MSLTTIAWVLVYGVALVGALSSPLFPLFGYLVEYYQRPDLYWWGRELPNLRWNFTIAVAAMASYIMHRDSLDQRRRIVMIPLVLMLAQALNTSIVSLWAVNSELSWKWSVAYWKLAVTFFLFSGFIRNAKALNLVILFQIVGTAYWGWDALDARRQNTRLEGIGSGDTQNSNTLAAHILTIIPLTIVFALIKDPLWMRGIAIVSLPFIINLLILANSRGATLGFVAAGAASLLLVRTGMRRHVFAGAVVGGLALFFLADDQFVTRQQTITSAQDGSAQTRLDLWAGAMGIVADYPLGAGGRGFHVLSPRYVAEIRETEGEGRSSHNTYIQVIVEWGIQGLVLFLGLIGYTFVLLHRVRKERTVADRAYFTSLGIQLGLIATLVAAVFSNRFFGESIYWLCGMATALYSMHYDGTKSAVPLESPQQAAA